MSTLSTTHKMGAVLLSQHWHKVPLGRESCLTFETFLVRPLEVGAGNWSLLAQELPCRRQGGVQWCIERAERAEPGGMEARRSPCIPHVLPSLKTSCSQGTMFCIPVCPDNVPRTGRRCGTEGLSQVFLHLQEG